MNKLGRILMVEDDPKDVELTLTALGRIQSRQRGRGCSRWRGGPGLSLLPGRVQLTRSDDNPAVLLLDLKLPKVDGLEVLQQIKSDEKLKMIPVVVLTSSHEEKDMVASYKLGVNAYVVKPVDFHEFVNAIKELGVFWAVINEPPPGSIKKTSPEMKSPLRILYLEDDPEGRRARSGNARESTDIPCQVTRVETEADFIASLEQGGFDLILADYTLPSFDGLSALKIARQHAAACAIHLCFRNLGRRSGH